MEKLKKIFENPAQLINNKKLVNGSKSFVAYIFRLVVLCAIGYIIIYPLLYMIGTSIKDKAAFFSSSRIWIPEGFDIGFNYSMAIDAINFWDGLGATLLLEIVAALIEICSCAIVAYGFARFKFRFKGALMACLFLTILVPETMIIIPRVVNYAKVDLFGILGLLDQLTGVDLRLKLIGTPFSFWIPSLFAIGLRSGILIFIYIQFFKNLPHELEEAAWVDGAGPIKTFLKIALPSSTVVITTVTVFAIIWHWNDSYLASMYMLEDFPLSVHLDRIAMTLSSMGYRDERVGTKAIYMAACVLFVVPPLILYMILQRQFIESIDRVGITG